MSRYDPEVLRQLAEVRTRGVMLSDDAAYQENARRLRERVEADAAYYGRRAREMQWERRGIPLRMREIVAAGVKETTSVQAVRRFMAADRDRWLLILCGTKGVGKSVAACVGVAENKRSALFTTLADVMADGPYGVMRDELQSVNLLVLDELGGQWDDAKGFSRGYLWDIFDARYREKAKTICTANVDWETLKAVYATGDTRGETFLDRARQGGSTFEPDEIESMRTEMP